MTKSSVELKIDGLPVRDAAKPLNLSISELDIPRSKVKNPASCAAAQACIRTLGAAEARVHLTRVYLKMPGKRFWMRYFTPASLRSEIVAFDRGGRFQPGEYALGVLPPSSTREAAKKRNDRRARHDQGKKTGKKRVVHYTQGVRANGHGELSG